MVAALLLLLALTFHPVPVKGVQTTRWTHVRVCGRVALSKVEEDGDIHLRIEDGARHFIVAEIIPAVPLPRPALGARICVDGISRRDPGHGWWEVHPVLAWRPAR
jgi:hypothetical protein